jgi:hypothetical protein
VKLPPNSLIADRKVREYLLKPRAEDDKSKFLALAGYTADHPGILISDLRQVLALDAEFVEDTEYGPKYQIAGTLTGPNGRSLRSSQFG